MTRKEETELTLFLTDHVGNLLQYSCLENPMDRGAWWATVHGITESDTAEQLTQEYRVGRTSRRQFFFFSKLKSS